MDVQHKKRGRPRLRDEETGRGVTYGGENSHPHLYSGQSQLLGLQGSDQRAQPRTLSYREIRSHPESSYGNSRASFSQASSNGYASTQDPLPSNQNIPEANPTAILTMDFVVLRSNYSFSEALSLRSSVEGRSIKDLLIPSDREKLQRLQNSLSGEVQEKAHLPSIRSSIPGPTLDILSATAGFQQRPEYWTFRLPHDQSRGFPVSISLAKASTYFLVLTLVAGSKPPPLTLPSTTRGWVPPLPSPLSVQSMRSPGLDHHSMSQMALGYPTAPPSRQPVIQPITTYRRSPSQPRDSNTSPSTGSAGTAPSSLHCSDVPRDNLRHLQLPPIQTSGIPGSSRSGDKGRGDGMGSSAKGSPQSAKRKKRRRVDLGEILR